MGEDIIWAPTHTGLVPVNREAVEWVEAHGDYVRLHTPPRSFLVRATMAGAEAWFPAGEMLRIHRSALVRPTSIVAVRRPARGRLCVQLRTGARVAVGRTYRAAVLAALNIRARCLCN